ncbi:MAG: response regulator [Solirubrobacterales bacterium]
MEKILIIEDCHLFRLQIKKALEQNGFSSIAELSSTDLIIKTPQLYLNDVILIILEMDMPGNSAVDFANSLKKNPEYFKIPIMFISGDNDYKTVQTAVEAGGIDFITKPFKFEVLVNRIEKVMNKIYGNVKGKLEDAQTVVMDILLNEYDRAVRAAKSLSFLLYTAENDHLESACKIIKHNLRKIDNVIIINGKILVILPLTREKNVTTVINKIEESVQQENITMILNRAVTFRPSTKISFDELKKQLFQK